MPSLVGAVPSISPHSRPLARAIAQGYAAAEGLGVPHELSARGLARVMMTAPDQGESLQATWVTPDCAAGAKQGS